MTIEEIEAKEAAALAEEAAALAEALDYWYAEVAANVSADEIWDGIDL